ncbi:MAG: YciI family protein [Rhodospirillales bacterium]
MLYALICRDKPDHAHVRAENRPAHLEHLKKLGGALWAAGPLLADDGETMTGSLIIVDFESPAEAEAFAAADPYAQAGLFEDVRIAPWKKVLP